MQLNSLMKPVLNGIKNAGSKALFTTKQHAPEILVASGAVGTIAAIVVACKETPKAEKVIADHNEFVEKVENAASGKLELKEGETYTEQDRKHDLIIGYRDLTIGMIRVYWKPFLIEAVSLAAIGYGFNIQKKRYTIAATTLAATLKEIDDYRQRVKGEVGPEKEQELYYNLKKKTVEEEETDKKGKTKTVEKEVTDKRSAKLPFNSRIFCEENNFLCSGDSSKDLLFLHGTEQYFTDILKKRGHVTAEEVLRKLGYTGTANMGGPNEMTRHCGWTYDRLNPMARSNFVDFGIGDEFSDSQFQSMYNDDCFLLNFNWYPIDGKIDWNYVDSDRYTSYLKSVKGN